LGGNRIIYKENIIKILTDMDLPLNEYWITSGAALDGLPVVGLESIKNKRQS